MTGQSGNRLTAAEQLEEYLDQFSKVAAEIADITAAIGAKDHHSYWERATRITECEPDFALGAFTVEGSEQRRQVLIWDEYGPVARLDATVFGSGIVLIKRMDDGYMAVRLVDGIRQPVGKPMLNRGHVVDGQLGAGVTSPNDLLDFLELAFQENELDD